MPRTYYDLKNLVRITASCVGLPGQRTFYIQARDSERLFTLLCEKEHVRALADGIVVLLAELDEKHPQSEPPVPVSPADLELEQPLEPVFRIGQMGLGYDQDADALVVVAHEAPEDETTDPDTLSVARFWATRSQMRALAEYAASVVEAGRPIGPLCGEPMDPSGHICPKKNGHKKVDLA